MKELQPVPRNQLTPTSRLGSVIDVTPAPPGVRIDVPGSGMKDTGVGLHVYWQMIRRNKVAVVLATFLGGLLLVLLTLSAPRIYQARATLEFQDINEEFLNMKNVNPVSDAGYQDTNIQTQVKLLQSRGLINSVRKKLEVGKPPEKLEPPDRLGTWRKALNIAPPTPAVLWRDALSVAENNVVARASGATRIMEVSCDSTNAQVAADFCNTLTQVYIDQGLEARWKTTEYTGQWLTKQLQDLKVKMEKQEEDLQSYARATGLMITSGSSDDSRVTQIADLEKELSTARADRINKQSKFEMASSSPAAALSDVLDDPALKDSQKTISDSEARLAQLRVTYTPEMADVKKVQAQITSMQKSLDTAKANIVTRIRKDYEAAQRREKLLETTYNEQVKLLSGKAEETAHYSLLKRDVDATRLLYESLLQRLKEASIASALRANNIRVVDAAERPGFAYKPNMTQRGMLGLFFGFIAGVAFAVLRERADRTLQDPGDVTYHLGLSELGVVPSGELMAGSAFTRGTRAGALMSKADAAVPQGRIELVSWRQKTSVVAESFRTTLTSILYSRRTGDWPRVLLLTSASPKEGKTTVVSNLSITMAEITDRVLLIDGDMRRPRLHSVFDVENVNGLSNLLLEKTPLTPADIDRACTPTLVPGLYLMPSGSARSQASTLVHSPRFAELIRQARETFDTVIIDTPPMINIADARVIARMVDAVILVVRSGVTARDAAQLAKLRFAEDGISILGTILNYWNPTAPGYSYYKHYYEGYAQYYGGGKGHDHDDSGGGDGAGPADDGRGEARKWAAGLGPQPPLGDTPIRRESES